MNQYKISVIIPMYNVQQHLEHCVASVVTQKLDFDYEIIMIDDGSPDNSFSEAQKIAAQRGNIVVISQENKGLGGARNTGILHAKGKYVLFLDADDKLKKGALAKLVELAEKEKVDVLEFAAQGRNESGDKIYESTASSEQPMSGKVYYHSVRYMNSACNKLYRTDFLKSNYLLFKEKIFIEDFEFNTRVLAKAERVLATDIMGAYFLQTSDSITRNNDDKKIKKMQDDIIRVIKITSELLERDRDSEISLGFYQERLGFLTATLFYQLFKRDASYEEVKALKQKLEVENIFFPDFRVYDRKKEFFRRILLKNLYIYPLIFRIRKII